MHITKVHFDCRLPDDIFQALDAFWDCFLVQMLTLAGIVHMHRYLLNRTLGSTNPNWVDFHQRFAFMHGCLHELLTYRDELFAHWGKDLGEQMLQEKHREMTCTVNMQAPPGMPAVQASGSGNTPRRSRSSGGPAPGRQ